MCNEYVRILGSSITNVTFCSMKCCKFIHHAPIGALVLHLFKNQIAHSYTDDFLIVIRFCLHTRPLPLNLIPISLWPVTASDVCLWPKSVVHTWERERWQHCSGPRGSGAGEILHSQAGSRVYHGDRRNDLSAAAKIRLGKAVSLSNHEFCL